MTALRSPGRPKDLEKREAILDAARQLFAERGVDGVPIEAIAAQSGVSKVTVYGHFGDKAKIFEAVVARETDRMSRDLELVAEQGHDLRETLERFGHTLVQVITQPCHLAMDRSVALEAQRNPDMGRRFFEAGPGKVREILTGVLSDAVARGEITVEDTRQAAQDLLSLWMGYLAIERRFCGGCAPDAAELHGRVSHAVGLFLRANRV